MELELKINNKKVITGFGKINVGEFFTFEGSVYLRVAKGFNHNNVLVFHPCGGTPELTWFDDGPTDVIKARKVTLIVDL